MLIDGKRIILRSWKDEDINDLIEGLNNLNVSKWLAAVPYPYTRKDANEFISYAKKSDEDSKDFMLAIVLKENNKVIEEHQYNLSIKRMELLQVEYGRMKNIRKMDMVQRPLVQEQILL